MNGWDLCSTPFRNLLGYPPDSCSTYPNLKDMMHLLMRREIQPVYFNTVRTQLPFR